jgi:hypothetical protein
MMPGVRLYVDWSRALGWLLTTSIAIGAVAELLLVSKYTGWADIQASVPDEAMFIEIAKGGFAHFGLGYGPIFWGSLVLILKLSPMQWAVLVARVVFVLLKYAAFAIVTRTFWQKDQKLAATVFLTVMLGAPGFLFLGKIISPEYELLFWAALLIKALIEDQGQLGLHYLWAIFYAFLATLTKLSGLPLLFILVFFGLIFGFLDARNDQTKSYMQLVARFAGLLAMLGLAMYFFPWQRSIFTDISETFRQVIPPLVLNVDAVKFSWQYDGVTWDQIKQGGIHKDFMPILALAIAATILLTMLAKEKNSRPGLAIFLAAVAITLSTIFHNMGHTWYLFLPALLFAAAGAQLAGSYGKRVQLTVLAIVMLAVSTSSPRLQERVEFKLANNREMSMAEADAHVMVAAARNRFPCIRSANFDVLIPWQLNDPDFLPMRIALEEKLNKSYVPADLLAVNAGLPSAARSPLLQFVVGDGISAYRLLSSTKRVDMYIRKDVQCAAPIELN